MRLQSVTSSRARTRGGDDPSDVLGGLMNAGSGIDPVIAAKNWRHV